MYIDAPALALVVTAWLAAQVAARICEHRENMAGIAAELAVNLAGAGGQAEAIGYAVGAEEWPDDDDELPFGFRR